jgi:hypothetical protein
MDQRRYPWRIARPWKIKEAAHQSIRESSFNAKVVVAEQLASLPVAPLVYRQALLPVIPSPMAYIGVSFASDVNDRSSKGSEHAPYFIQCYVRVFQMAQDRIARYDVEAFLLEWQDVCIGMYNVPGLAEMRRDAPDYIRVYVDPYRGPTN